MTNLAPHSKDREWPLPDDWRWVTLSNMLLTLESGSRPPGGAIGITSGVPSISAEQMTDRGTFNFSVMRYVPLDYSQEMKRGRIEVGDILIVKDGATTGKTCLVDEDFPFGEAVVNEHVFICRPNPKKIIPRFLFYWLWSPPGQYAIRNAFQGAAIGGINQKFADTVELPITSLDEQKRIVTILNHKMSAIERARNASDHRLEAVEALRRAFFELYFENGEASKWPIRTVRELTTLVIDGPHITPTYLPKGIPFVTVKNITSGKLDLGDVNFISEQDYEEFSKRGKPERGDILYSKDGTMGIPCLVETNEEFSFFVSVALIKPDRNQINPRFLTYALEAPRILAQVDKLAAGAGLKHMVLKSIRSLEIPVPPMEKQEALAESFHGKLAHWKNLGVGIRSERETIDALPEVILRQAFSGNL